MTARDLLLLAISLVARCQATNQTRIDYRPEPGLSSITYSVYSPEGFGFAALEIRIHFGGTAKTKIQSVSLNGLGLDYKGINDSQGCDETFVAFETVFAAATASAMKRRVAQNG